MCTSLDQSVFPARWCADHSKTYGFLAGGISESLSSFSSRLRRLFVITFFRVRLQYRQLRRLDLWVLSIMPQIPENSVGIQMERSVWVSSDHNICDHPWRWSTYLGRNILTEIFNLVPRTFTLTWAPKSFPIGYATPVLVEFY